MEEPRFYIYPATTTHIPAIREITMQVWPPTYTPIIGKQQVAYMIGLFYAPAALEKQMEQGHRFILCYSEGKALGFAAWSEIEPGIFKLHKLYVRTNQQGKGIGRALLEYIVTEIKKENATALRLNVNIHNSPAINFYKKSGFTHYKDEDIDIGKGYFMNDHILELKIK